MNYGDTSLFNNEVAATHAIQLQRTFLHNSYVSGNHPVDGRMVH